MELARDSIPSTNVGAADWFAWLDPDDQAACAADFAGLLANGCHPESRDYVQLWTEWQATAEAWHDPEIRAALTN